MTKYLICESKARAMGISRETYVAYVESQGYTYSNDTHSDDAYGLIEKVTEIEGKEYALVVDDTKPYYTNIPEILKGRLLTDVDMVADGWDIPITEVVE